MSPAVRRTTRRSLLGGVIGLALGTGGDRARPPLISQRAAHYQPRPHDGMFCAMCSFFSPPGSCKVVAGAINPQGWCKFFDLSD